MARAVHRSFTCTYVSKSCQQFHTDTLSCLKSIQIYFEKAHSNCMKVKLGLDVYADVYILENVFFVFFFCFFLLKPDFFHESIILACPN